MSTTPDHDRDIARLLRQRLPGVTPATAACVDSEALAAWVDGGLDATARLAAEAHVADCPRCQAIVATLIQSAPPEPVPVPWWRTALVRWLAPMALATAATTVWFLLPSRAPMSTEGLPAQARNDAPAFQAQSPTSADEGPHAARAKPDNAPRPGADESAQGLAAKSKEEVPAPAPARPVAPPATFADRLGADRDARGGAAAPADRGAAAVAPSPRPVPSVTVPSEATANTMEQARRADRQAERREGFAPVTATEQPQPTQKMAEAVAAAPQVAGGVTAHAPVAQNAPAAPPAPRAQAPVSAAAAAPETGGAGVGGTTTLARSRLADAADAAGQRVGVVSSPNGRDRWRIVGGRIERSADGGVTWDGSPVAGAVDVIAGVSPASGICWFVGRSGTILLTDDGARWQRVAAPVDEDLVSVSATSASRAVVTTRAGRRYTTINAGTTWR